jgi:hypothetical protein
MASHWPFGHLQPKLWAKEGPRVKLAIWFPTTKSWESTSSRHPIWACDMALKRSRWGLQLRFRPCCDRTLQSGVMTVQSSNFGSDLLAIGLYNRELWPFKVSTLVQTSSQSDSAVGSYDRSKFQESRRDNFGTPFWESREFVPFGCSLHGELKRILSGVRWWLTPESGPWWVLCVQVPVASPNTQGCPEC